MPPPTLPSQSTRGGLITTIVVFVILTLVLAVFYFQERGIRQQAQTDLKNLQDREKQMLPSDRQDPSFVKAMDERGNKSAFGHVADQMSTLSRAITGQPGVSADAAKQFAEGAINDTQQQLKKANIAPESRGLNASPNDGLYRTLMKFASGYVKLDGELNQAKKNISDANQKLEASQKQHQDELAGKDKEIKKGQDDLAARQADLQAVTQQQAQALNDVTGNVNLQISQLNEQKAQLETQVATLKTDAKQKKDEVASMVKLLSRWRLDPRDSLVRQPDGQITRVPGDGTCLINLGLGDGIPAGMTFEVYDRARGIPSLSTDSEALEDDTAVQKSTGSLSAKGKADAGAAAALGVAVNTNTKYETQLPAGFKGSIEVISVGPGHTAQCRIINVEKGQILQEGDVIANIVYSKQIKLNFGIFGDFDLDYNGKPSTADTTTVKRHIAEWGANSTTIKQPSDLTVNVDFLVMGVAPSIPVLTNEQMGDAILVQQLEQAKAARERYDQVLDMAKKYSIPVLNQTRFLYYTGYWSQRTR